MQAHPLIFDTAIAKDKPENIRHPHNACPFCDPQQLTDILAQDADRIWLVIGLNPFCCTKTLVPIQVVVCAIPICRLLA